MHHSEPFHWVMGLSVIGATFSVIEMNEAFRFIILLGTSIGVLVKTWEQVRRSEGFLQDIKLIWITTKNKILRK